MINKVKVNSNYLVDCKILQVYDKYFILRESVCDFLVPVKSLKLDLSQSQIHTYCKGRQNTERFHQSYQSISGTELILILGCIKCLFSMNDTRIVCVGFSYLSETQVCMQTASVPSLISTSLDAKSSRQFGAPLSVSFELSFSLIKQLAKPTRFLS